MSGFQLGWVLKTLLTHVSCIFLPMASQVGKVLGNDPSGRAAFVHSGGLAAVQQMAEAPGSKLKEAVEIINSAYPEEVCSRAPACVAAA